MITSNLVVLYRNYYKQYRTWPMLFKALKDYEFDDLPTLQEEVLAMTPEVADDSDQQSNSGLRYQFAPVFIKEDIENYLRYEALIDEYYFICENPTREESVEVQSGKIQHTLKIPDIWSHWEEVAQFLTRVPNKTYVLGYANSLAQMTANQQFLEKVQDHVIGFVNSHGPAFLKTGLLSNFEFNDQMINWKSGANFRTCQYGNKHCLPIFAVKDGKGCNLLNFNRLWFPVDDLFELQDPCKCGKPCIKLVPHINNIPDGVNYEAAMGLPERLESKFRWLQFIQDRDLRIFYETSGEILSSDLDVINETLGTFPLCKGNFLQVGAKFPPFWKIRKIL